MVAVRANQCPATASSSPWMSTRARTRRDRTAGDPHSEIMRHALISLLGNADTLLQATETGSGRTRAYPGVLATWQSDVVALSLITAVPRGTGLWVRRAMPAVS